MDPPYNRQLFLNLIEGAIRNLRQNRFHLTINEFQRYSDIFLSDDGSFKQLCDEDNYVIFLYELIECWVDSGSAAKGDYSLEPSHFAELAESVLADIACNRPPSNVMWYQIYTLRCRRCRRNTVLADGLFRCEHCEIAVPFKGPAD